MGAGRFARPHRDRLAAFAQSPDHGSKERTRPRTIPEPCPNANTGRGSGQAPSTEFAPRSHSVGLGYHWAPPRSAWRFLLGTATLRVAFAPGYPHAPRGVSGTVTFHFIPPPLPVIPIPRGNRAFRVPRWTATPGEKPSPQTRGPPEMCLIWEVSQTPRGAWWYPYSFPNATRSVAVPKLDLTRHAERGGTQTRKRHAERGGTQNGTQDANGGSPAADFRADSAPA